MRVKALKTLGGAVNAQAGEEFELTNEAQLHDLLNQGVVVPVESNPQEVARIHHLSAQQLADARDQHVEQTKVNDLAYAEAVQFANNQMVDEVEKQREQKIKEARSQAEQQAKHAFQQEESLRQAEAQLEQMRQQSKQEQEMKKSSARQQATQRNQSQSQAQTQPEQKKQ